MAITAAQVKELRELTGAGMMECKNALVESGGDINKAIEEMRKRGQARADIKSSRVAAEGIVVIKRVPGHAVMLEANTETDFVGREISFIAFCDEVVDRALAAKVRDIEQLSNLPLSDGITIEERRKELIAKIGENINLRRVADIQTDGFIGTYLHGNRIGVLVEMQGGNEALAKDIAMHIAASAPIVRAGSDVPEELIAKEREIFKAQALQSGKPADIVEKMIDGRIKKFLDEVSLLGQPYVKDPSVTIAQLLKAANADVVRFVRFAVGEGIEKKEENFAQEVMAQINK